MSRPAQCQIDYSAIQHNYRRVKTLAPQSMAMAVVKANAYGHGLKKAGLALAEINVDAFAVACLEEALILRQAGIKQPIVLLEGFFATDELPVISAQNLEVVVHHAWQLEILKTIRLAKPVKVWLKIDTGMHRLGFQPQEIKLIWQQLQTCAAVNPEIGIMSHFACADDIKHPGTEHQIKYFNDCIQGLPAHFSLSNSAGILSCPAAHKDWVRPGIMLYGVSPFPDKIGADYNLKPAMTLRSEIIATRVVKKGEAVGYGATWVCPYDMLVGVIALGYGDGYPRDAKNGTPVLVNHKIVPLVGRVSMDMLTVDLTSQPGVKAGDPVVLWGEELPAEQVARHTHTIAYELLCKVTQRVFLAQD